jgi:Protein of unknown function (DUF2911)
MKKTLLTLAAAALLAFGSQAQGLKTPAPSPAQTIKQDFALSSIEVSYSRPSVKGRAIYGDLVPYGKLWRTGANSGTKIKFGEDVKVGGVAVKAGEYVVFTIPNKDEWEFILNKASKGSGVNDYNVAEDVAHIKVKPTTLPMKVESFMVELDNVTNNSAELGILWDNVGVFVTIEAEVDTKIMSQIDQVMNKDNKPYFQAAGYYFDNGKDLKQALDWANKAVEAQPKAFWVMHLKAKIQAKLGDKVGAKEAALKSIELAKEAKNGDYVTLNEKLITSLK